MKLKEKVRATQLRERGRSYSEILKQVNVSRSTLSLWLRDIQLTSEQREKIHATLRQKNAYKGAKVQQQKRIKITAQIIAEAKQEVKQLAKDPIFLAGLMLYWAEGSKSDISELVDFSNSDPSMVIFMMKWFREFCKVPESKFRVKIHIHTLHCRKDIERYWSDITGTPLEQFHKTQIKPTSLGHRKNLLYNGTCAIIICSKDLFRRIKGWRLGFLKSIDIDTEGNNMSP